MHVARFAGLLAFILAASFSQLGAQEYSIRVDVSAGLAKDPWFEVQSRNFRVAGNATTKQLQRIAVDLEEIRRQFLSVFPKSAASTVPTTVVVFRNDKSLRLLVDPSATITGVHAGIDRNYIVLNAGENRRQSVYHDYVLTLIGDHALPLWLREGLAEYFGSIENERYLVGEYRTAKIGYPISSHEKLLKDRFLLPVVELFGMTEDSAAFDQNTTKGVFIAESWALVHMLQSSGSDLMKRLLELLLDGHPFRQSFEAVYAAEPAIVEAGLKDYIQTSKKSGWTYTSIPYCLCDSKPNDWQQFNFDRTQSYIKDLGDRRLTPAQIRFYIGDLLLHRGSFEEASAYLQDALRLDPQLAAAHASLGVLRIRQERYDEAKDHIDQALALGSDDPLPYLSYARLIRRDAPTPDQLTEEQLQNMQLALLKAVRFGPHLLEAAEMLNEVDSLLGQR
jgi:tetratricopeptide (TPR) repeat protein